jgi:hypothetical protein
MLITLLYESELVMLLKVQYFMHIHPILIVIRMEKLKKMTINLSTDRKCPDIISNRAFYNYTCIINYQKL